MSSVADFPETADPVASMLASQVTEGIAAIIEANEVLLANETADASADPSSKRNVDKALKDYVDPENKDDLDPEVLKAVQQMEKARAAFKTSQEKARNLYRVNVLKVEEVTESDVDEEEEKALKEQTKNRRNLVMQSVNLLRDYAETNNLTEVFNWAGSIEIPQVGRQGASTVGQKKPRAYVSVNGTTHESFGEAAKALTALLSTDENKVEITSPDLVSAWVDAGEGEKFTFQGYDVTVTPKETKKRSAA